MTPMTWSDHVVNLRKSLGREPSLNELLDLNRGYTMTPAEIEMQRQSWVRGMTTRCEHGELDFEQCPKCMGWS